MRRNALQPFKNITSPTAEKLKGPQPVFGMKYIKPQSMVTAKCNWHQFFFNPPKENLRDFLDEGQKHAIEAFGIAAQAIIEQFLHAKMQKHLKKSINHALLADGANNHIVKQIER